MKGRKFPKLFDNIGYIKVLNNCNISVTHKIPTPPLHILNEIGGRLYPDLRHFFIQTLRGYALLNRNAAHQRTIFDTAVQVIVILSLKMTPIRTHYCLRRIRGIGTELFKILHEAEKKTWSW